MYYAHFVKKKSISFANDCLISTTLSCKPMREKKKNWNDDNQNFTEMDVFHAFGDL